MKKIFFTTLTASILCACMAFGLAGCGASQKDIDDAVNAATAPLNEQITKLNKDIADKEAEIAALESEKAALEKEKATLTANVAELETQVTTLTAKVAELEASEKANEAEIAELEETIASKNSEIETLKSTISTLNAKIAELEASITAKDKEMATLESKIAVLEGKVTVLENCLEGKHVADEEGTASYVWADDYSTCTATVACAYCETGEASETATAVEGENLVATFESTAFEAQTVYTVTTYDELNSLLQSGETVHIRLDASIENAQMLVGRPNTVAILDLNGNNIEFTDANLHNDKATLTLKGTGVISATGTTTIFNYGTLYIEDSVTVDGDWYAIALDGDSDQNAVLVMNGGTLATSGKGVNIIPTNSYVDVVIQGGTFSEDPTEYVDTEDYNVTQNKDGTYVVTEKNAAYYKDRVAALENCLKGDHVYEYTDNNDGTHTEACKHCNSEKTPEEHTYDTTNECDCGAKVTLVSTVEELTAACENSGNYKLMNDLDIGETGLSFGMTASVVLDLNGYTVSGAYFSVLWVGGGGRLTLLNGTVKNTASASCAVCSYGTLTVKNCTLIANEYYALYISDGNATVENTVLTGGVTVSTAYGVASILTAKNNVSITGDVSVKNTGVATFGFDPTDLFDYYNQGTATDNGDGTWTVKVVE